MSVFCPAQLVNVEESFCCEVPHCCATATSTTTPATTVRKDPMFVDSPIDKVDNCARLIHPWKSGCWWWWNICDGPELINNFFSSLCRFWISFVYCYRTNSISSRGSSGSRGNRGSALYTAISWSFIATIIHLDHLIITGGMNAIMINIAQCYFMTCLLLTSLQRCPTNWQCRYGAQNL